MMSVFQKKKEPLMSVAPRMSVMPKNQSVYSSNSSYAATNPLSKLGQSASKGTSQSTFRASAPTQSVFQSKAVTSAPKQIQGSGMSSAYTSNPSNYKPAVPTPPPAPTVPKITTPTNPYVQGVEQLSNQQADFIKRQQAQREGSVKSKYQTLKEMISGQLPVAEQNFNAYKQDSQADIEALRDTGERQKGQAADYYGEAQRDAAKTLNETQGQNQRTFAGLGTLDSRGEGSFQQATENTTSDFNRFTQQTLRAKADRFAEIDTTVSTAERQAQAAIRQEAAKLEDLKKQIQFALINNDQAMADELSGVAQEAEQNIMAIQEAVTGLKYQADLEKYNIELQGNEKLSPEFLQTGVPQTEADFTWKLNNGKEYGEAFPGMSSGGQNSNNKASSIITQLQNMSTQGITGRMRFGISDEARNAEGLLKQLSSELQLEEAKRLKGQGAMSDAERAILANSIAAFNLDKNGRPQVSDSRFQQILSELQAGFGNQSGQTMRVRDKASGQTGTIPVGEFNPAQYEQI